jgi:hypothetical protein
MIRWLMPISFAVVLALTPLTDAASSSSSSSGSSGGGVQGKIQSVAPTNFTVGIAGHGRHRRRGGGTAVVVHYNPDTVTITVDGAPVRSLDVAATGKYVSIVGTMKNAVLEATSITVSSSPPAHSKKNKSST